MLSFGKFSQFYSIPNLKCENEIFKMVIKSNQKSCWEYQFERSKRIHLGPFINDSGAFIQAGLMVGIWSLHLKIERSMFHHRPDPTANATKGGDNSKTLS